MKLNRIALLVGCLVAISLSAPARAQHGAHDNSAQAVEKRLEAASDHGVHVDPSRVSGDTVHADGEVHGNEVGHGGGHAKEGLIEFHPERLIWTVVIFLVLLAILYPTAWKNILAGLKKREEKIRQDIADAEAARTRAETTLREYNARLADAETRVREMLSKGQADAEKLATTIRMQAQQEAEEAKERAMRDIEAARTAAVRDVYAQAANLSTAVAEKILRRNLNPDDQRDLVQRSLEQLEGVGGR